MENVSGQSPSSSIALHCFGQRTGWAILLTLVFALLAIVLLPAWLIQPFKHQTRGDLELAYALRRWAPIVTPVALAGALVLALWLWRATSGWWRKAALIVALIPALGAAWFARQNHFEWMFHSLPSAAYASASEAGFVADGDMVISVELKGEAVAYPVRQIAYHHLVQDVVGGKPVVATY